MTSRTFFDSNVLIYTLVVGDPRCDIAANCLADGGVISVQVLNEFAHVARRKFKRSWAEIRQALAEIRVLCPSVLPMDVRSHETAVTIAEQTGYTLFDALMIAAALEAGCDTLYSEDMQDGRVIDGRLTIRNPFAALNGGNGASP